DPVLTWAMGNAVAREDANGNIQLAKNRSRDRIDPAVALVTAHARAMHAEGASGDVSEVVDDEFLDKLCGRARWRVNGGNNRIPGPGGGPGTGWLAVFALSRSGRSSAWPTRAC